MANVDGRFISQVIESTANQINLSDSREVDKKYEKEMKKKYEKTKKKCLAVLKGDGKSRERIKRTNFGLIIGS